MVCFGFRNVINAARPSRTATPSTTAAPAGKGSATPAPPSPDPCQREAGDSLQCGSVKPAFRTGASQKVDLINLPYDPGLDKPGHLWVQMIYLFFRLK